MESRRIFRTVAWLIATSLSSLAADQPLRLIHTIPLAGVKGRFDHFACDPKAERLIVAALGNNTAEVFGGSDFKHTGTITGLRKPTGTLVLPEAKRFFVANGDDGTLRVFDAASLEPAAQLRGLDDADNVRSDLKARRIYIGYGEGALGVTDESAGKLLYSIRLPAHPESFQLESHGPRIFVNVPGKQQIAVIDREQRKIVATWPLDKWRANFPMAIDESNHRLLVGCRNPPRLVVFDIDRGVSVNDVEISGDTDDLFYDAKRHRVYLSCGEGFLDVIDQRTPDRYERTARIPTRAGARTCYFSPDLDRLFLAVPERSATPAELRVYQPD